MKNQEKNVILFSYPIWKTIITITYSSFDDLIDVTLNAEYQISAWAEEIIKTCKVPSLIEEKRDFVKLSVKDLDLTEGAYYRQISKRALRRGLGMCTPLDAVQLCSEYIGERLVIAMSPITQTDGNLDILTIGFDKKKVLTLGNVSGGPGAFWSSKTEFIFRKL